MLEVTISIIIRGSGRACSNENSWLHIPFDQKISFQTSLTKTRLKIFTLSLTNSDDLFFKSSTTNRRIFSTFSKLSRAKPLISPRIFAVYPSKNLMTFF